MSKPSPTAPAPSGARAEPGRAGSSGARASAGPEARSGEARSEAQPSEVRGGDLDGRTRRAQEAREVRRAQILEAALRVFAERGYHAASVSDLVEAAGVARGTFYLYFDSKDAVFHELLDDLLGALRASVVGVDTRPDAPPVREQLHRTLVLLFAAVDGNRAFVRILLREAVGLDAAVGEKLRTFYDRLHAWVDHSLRRGQEMGVVRALDTDVVAVCVVGTVKHVLERWLVESDAPVDVARLASAVLDYALDGISVADPAVR